MFSDRTLSKISTSLSPGALRAGGKLNVPIYRLTRGRLFGHIGRAPVLLLTTTGRKSGQKRTAPVVYLADGDSMVVVGSNAGNERPPAWSLNLLANPDAEVQVRGKRMEIRARVPEGEEHDELWRKVNEQYAGFDDYKSRTTRNIKLFVLEPRTHG
jgi:F420H(2)-dependent quinone reductase